MKRNWEKPNCNICGNKKNLKLLWKGVTTWEHPGKFDFVKCQKCGLVFQSPRAPFKDAVQYYPSEAYWGRDVTKLKETKNKKIEREEAYSYLYDEIFSKKKKKGKILDVGSGLGLFLSKFKEKGWETLGTDISDDIAKYSKKLFGVKVLVGDVVEIKLPENSFDLITLNGVFEHIYDPSKALIKFKKLLKNDGLLVLVVPNIESLGYKIHKDKWIAMQPGRHIYQFSPKTIKKLLEKEGFIIENIGYNFYAHNYFHIFETIKYRFSPKFKKKKSGGLIAKNITENLGEKHGFPYKIAILLTDLTARIGCLIEPLIKRSEVITVYAKKA